MGGIGGKRQLSIQGASSFTCKGDRFVCKSFIECLSRCPECRRVVCACYGVAVAPDALRQVPTLVSLWLRA